jgi:hypothetical protein
VAQPPEKSSAKATTIAAAMVVVERIGKGYKGFIVTND